MKSPVYVVILVVVWSACGLLPSPALALTSNPIGTGLEGQAAMSSSSAGREEESADDTAGMIGSKVKVRTRGGLKVKSADGDFSFALGGRVAVEGAVYQEDKNTLGDGTALDAVRINLDGSVYRHWSFEMSLAFEDGDTDILDANIAYTGWWPVLTLGQFKEPFSLEELTSSRYTTFMERALPNVLTPGRNIGVGLSLAGNQWSAAAGVFGEDFNDDVPDEGDESWGATARLTWAPFYETSGLLHLGAAVSWRSTGDEKVVSFDAKPESNITDLEFVDTDDIDLVDAVGRYGAEVAVVWGPVSLQGEYIQIAVLRDQPADDLIFDGWYAYGSWVITGESRSYRAGKGVFGPIKPQHAYGAWEVALRYSTLNLTDEPVLGGEEENLTLGINWYANRHVRFYLNTIWVQTDINADAAGTALGEDNPVIYQARVQFDF